MTYHIVSKPPRFDLDNVITYQPAISLGDRLRIDATSFGLSRSTPKRLQVITTVEMQGVMRAALKPAAIIFDSKTGYLFFNENGRAPGFGNGGLAGVVMNDTVGYVDFIWT